MQAFIDFCTYSYARPKIPCEKTKEEPKPVIYQCANFACISETTSPQTWITTCVNKRFSYICSTACYETWLDTPGLIGAWSPTIKPEEDIVNPKQIENLSL